MSCGLFRNPMKRRTASRRDPTSVMEGAVKLVIAAHVVTMRVFMRHDQFKA